MAGGAGERGARRSRKRSKRAYVKPYPQEFREQAVKLAQVGGRRPREIAEEFRTSPDSAPRWMPQAERHQGLRQDGLRSEERRELALLRWENRRLRMDGQRVTVMPAISCMGARSTDSSRGIHHGSPRDTSPSEVLEVQEGRGGSRWADLLRSVPRPGETGGAGRSIR